jgi:hypothetical protein
MYTVRMTEGNSIQSQLNEFNCLIIDVKIENEDQAIVLLISLRATFKQYNKIMLYGTSDTLKLDDACICYQRRNLMLILILKIGEMV